MRRIIVRSALALLVSAAPLAAQSTNFGLGAFAGVSMPMGDFSSDEGAEAGFAEIGFVGGLDLFYPFGPTGLSWLTTASVNAHSVDQPGVEGGYLFIPLITGIRYDIAAGPIGLFLTAQGGAVFNKGPNFTDPLAEANAEWDTDFGFALGAGVQATRNIYGGLKYFPLGDVDFSYEGVAEPLAQNVSFLEIFVGFGVR